MKRAAEKLRGVATILYLALSLGFWGIPVTTFAIVKLLMPTAATRRVAVRMVVWFAERWSLTNSLWFRYGLRTEFVLQGMPPSDKAGHYLIISNHQSWADIYVLFHVFTGRIPFIRFFLKQELIWVPVAGVACWAMEFPFMKRHSAEYLAKHPEKRGEDLRTTQRMCERYRHLPVSVLIFLEGTRFTQAKHDEQKSPYRHLLRPRTGGIAYAFATLGTVLDHVLDVTVAYPKSERITLWDFACGRIPRIVIDAHRVEVPSEFLSDAIIHPTAEHKHFKEWLREMWKAKDERLEELREEDVSSAPEGAIGQ